MAKFLRDRDLGEAAEQVVSDFISLKWSQYNPKVFKLDRKDSHLGDLKCGYIVGDENKEFTVEVKYDIKAKYTNNLCFEVANAKGELCGIASTEADYIIFLTPFENKLRVFVFETRKLVDYLYDKKNLDKIKTIQGGDRKSYTLLLVSIDNILEDNVASLVEFLDKRV